MNKKNIFYLILLFVLIPSINVYSYEFVDENNKSSVYDKFNEIISARELYEELAGGYTETIVYSTTSDYYWWPIGSAETTTVSGITYAKGDPETVNVTSKFGNRILNGSLNKHGGIDIAGGSGLGSVNIIASKSGVVIDINDGCSSDGSDKNCGYTYGNYVTIQHADGMYTHYAHLYAGSLTVKVGDSVEQGQVIAKMGNSGNSYGAHLHFEVRTDSSSRSRVDPLDGYVDPENPRPESISSDGFSLTTSSLTKEEFVKKMNDFCESGASGDFCSVFAKNAEEIYDVSHANGVNPELVVVTAGTEQSWVNCGSTNNYWGINIPNGSGCSAGPHYSTLKDGIKGYAKTLARYQEGGSYASYIENLYYQRLEAGADPAGIGLPGTFAGMQMVYSYLGKHEYGSSGAGGYYYMDPARAGVTTIYSTHEEFVSKCLNAGGEHAAGEPVTAWEQSRYTIFQMEGKVKLRYKIFGI